MATYRTIRMSFWNDPAIESLPPADKLLYLYLFTCPHANNLGVLSVSLRKMAFETGLSEDVSSAGWRPSSPPGASCATAGMSGCAASSGTSAAPRPKS